MQVFDNQMQYISRDEIGAEYLNFRGQRMPILMRIPFIYVVPTISDLAAGATSSAAQFLVDSGSYFLWQQGVYEFDLNSAAYTYSTRPMPNYSITINDSGSGRNLQNTPVPIGARFGAVEKPVTYLLPYLFAPAATVQVQVTNFDAAVANGDLRLAFIGQQVFMK